MMVSGPLNHDDDEDEFDPLSQGAAAPPPIIGGGCLARFDPLTLNEESGADSCPDSHAD